MSCSFTVVVIARIYAQCVVHQFFNHYCYSYLSKPVDFLLSWHIVAKLAFSLDIVIIIQVIGNVILVHPILSVW
jgi:hypothetical protein